MARERTSKRLTRRDAVALLGAGTVFGTVRLESRHAGDFLQAGKECKDPAKVLKLTAGTGKKARQILFVDSCCSETKNAILVGVEDPGKKATKLGKTHLAPVQRDLNAANLEEYCFMVWGLDEAQVKAMYDMVPTRLKLQKVPQEPKE